MRRSDMCCWRSPSGSGSSARSGRWGPVTCRETAIPGSFVNRTLIAVVVGATLTAAYLATLWIAGTLLDQTVSVTAANLLAAGAVAIICLPVVSATRRALSRWLGRRTTALTFAERLREVSADHPALDELATMVARELRLGSVLLVVDGLDPAQVGAPDGPEHRFELRRGDTSVGTMVVCARRGESLATPDIRTLREIARFVAVAVDAIRLNEQLRSAQEALTRAHVEERRRVRRDLHDGLGPTLASIRMRLARRRYTVIDAPVLDEIFEQVTDAIREVRRIVDGLQPSVLEDLGLVPALQILVSDTRDATSLDIVFEATGLVPEPPADIATAAYRSVAEALANVARHSRATSCTVRLARTGRDLQVEVTDNGRGFRPGSARGMGLRSMQTRAAALGGTIDIASHLGEGTRVAVRLPT
jgi:two-component system, NarL family, sensor kinase